MALKVEFPLLAVDVHDVCLLDLVCIFSFFDIYCLELLCVRATKSQSVQF